MWLMAREGELGGRCWHTCALPLFHVQGNGVQTDWPPPAPAQGSDTVETVGRSCLLPAWCWLGGINRGRLFPSCQSHASQKLHMLSSK